MFDFVKCAKEHNIPVDPNKHSTEGWVQTHCPSCKRGRDGWHLGFNLTTGVFNCWKCGVLPKVMVLGMLIPDQNPYDLLRKYETNTRQQRPSKKPIVRTRNIILPLGTRELLWVHKLYLSNRGFPVDSTVKFWKLQATHHLGKEWSWRIIIPIFNLHGEMISYQGRTVTNHIKPKYLTLSDELSKQSIKSVLYGEEHVQGDTVIVVEGVTDVWRIGPGAVATFGIDWSIEQAARLVRFKHRIILFDPGKIAQKRAKELAQWLSYAPGTTEIITGLNSDPGDMTDEEIQEVRNELGLGKHE